MLFGGITRRYDKKLVSKNSLIFINSVYTKNKLDPIYNINSIVSYPPILSNFIPTPSSKVLSKFNIDKPYIITSGRIIKYKRYDLLIKAFSQIENKECILVIVGKWDNKEYSHLITMATELNVIDRIRFLGFVHTDDLISLYSSAIAFTMPTMKSDYGYVTAEAVCCGCPIITWGDGGGSCEQTIDGFNGYTAKPYDISDFADKIDKCISENFKEKHKEDILDSSKPFTFDYQENIFIENIKLLLKPKSLNTPISYDK
jgi:glycosyltransferase involved in cell wall biosynthesis